MKYLLNFMVSKKNDLISEGSSIMHRGEMTTIMINTAIIPTTRMEGEIT